MDRLQNVIDSLHRGTFQNRFVRQELVEKEKGERRKEPL